MAMTIVICTRDTPLPLGARRLLGLGRWLIRILRSSASVGIDIIVAVAIAVLVRRFYAFIRARGL